MKEGAFISVLKPKGIGNAIRFHIFGIFNTFSLLFENLLLLNRKCLCK